MRENRLKPGTRFQVASLRTKRRIQCTIGPRLGAGGTAIIHTGVLSDGTHVVVKTPRWAGEMDPAFDREYGLFKEILHRNVVHCFGAGVLPSGELALCFRRAYSNPLILLAKVSAGVKRDSGAVYPSLPLDVAMDLSYELLSALAYLEGQGIVHHDVKLSNLLVDVAPRARPVSGAEAFGMIARREYRAVLIDFGASRTWDELERLNRGEESGRLKPQLTPFYAPPEAVVETRGKDGQLRRVFHPSLDTYAAAQLIYTMLTGHPPYSHLRNAPKPDDLESIVEVKSAERRGDLAALSREILLRIPCEDTRFSRTDRSSFCLDLFRLLSRRMHPDPNKRGTANQMKRDLEELLRIRPFSHDLEDRAASNKRIPRVFLPFQPRAFEMTWKLKHPLLRAAHERGLPAGAEPEAIPVEPTTHSWNSPLSPQRYAGPDEVTGPETRKRKRPPPRPQRKKPPGTGKHDRRASRRTTRSPRVEDRAAPTPAAPFRTGPEAFDFVVDGSRGYPVPTQAKHPHYLVSPVLGDPVLLSRERPFLIGRTREADIRINSDRVSRRHARIHWDGRGFVIADLGSSNGTQLNGGKIQACVLHDRDRINLGGFELVVRVPGEGERMDDETTGKGTGTQVFEGPPDLTGVLGELELMAVVELLEWKKRTGTLTIEPERESSGHIHFHEGRIVHAVASKARGAEAVVQLLSVREGRFKFAHEKESRCRRTIDMSNDDLWELVKRKAGQ